MSPRPGRNPRSLLLFVVAGLCGCATSGHPVADPTASAHAAPSTATSPATPGPTSAPTPPRSTRPAPPPTPTRTSTPPLAPSSLPQWLQGPVITRLPTTTRVIALTFDGGSGAQGAASVLATLAANRIPATFFLTGQFARSFPSTVAKVRAGHYLVGNHSMSHAHLTELTSAAVVKQITDGEVQLNPAIGGTTRPWFRFPFGEYDGRTLRLAHELGYGAIGWTVDTRGWQGRQAGGTADVVARVKAALRPGAIVLMHLGANPDDGTTYDADALPAVIAMVRAAGYRFVDLRAGYRG